MLAFLVCFLEGEHRFYCIVIRHTLIRLSLLDIVRVCQIFAFFDVLSIVFHVQSGLKVHIPEVTSNY